MEKHIIQLLLSDYQPINFSHNGAPHCLGIILSKLDKSPKMQWQPGMNPVAHVAAILFEEGCMLQDLTDYDKRRVINGIESMQAFEEEAGFTVYFPNIPFVK